MPDKVEPNALKNLADDELLTLAQGDDNSAFEELMRRTSSSSLKLALSVLKDRQDAEDAVQDSYFSAWRHIRQFHRDSKFSTWMTRIVMNHCLMKLRKTRKVSLVHIEDSANGESAVRFELPDRRETPEAQLDGKQLSAILDKEIRRLPPLFRGVLKMYHFDELSMEDLAGRCGISVAAAKSRLLRARSELKRRLEKRYGSLAQALVPA